MCFCPETAISAAVKISDFILPSFTAVSGAGAHTCVQMATLRGLKRDQNAIQGISDNFRLHSLPDANFPSLQSQLQQVLSHVTISNLTTHSHN